MQLGPGVLAAVGCRFVCTHVMKVQCMCCTQAVKGFFQGVTEGNFKYPLRVADAITYMGDLNEAVTSDNVCTFPIPEDEFTFAAEYEYEPPEEEDE